MLIRDLLKIFQCVNQGIITLLTIYFDLGKDEASVCLALYRRFIHQTEQVIAYLDSARGLEALLQFTVPQLKHVTQFFGRHLSCSGADFPIGIT